MHKPLLAAEGKGRGMTSTLKQSEASPGVRGDYNPLTHKDDKSTKFGSQAQGSSSRNLRETLDTPPSQPAAIALCPPPLLPWDPILDTLLSNISTTPGEPTCAALTCILWCVRVDTWSWSNLTCPCHHSSDRSSALCYFPIHYPCRCESLQVPPRHMSPLNQCTPTKTSQCASHYAKKYAEGSVQNLEYGQTCCADLDTIYTVLRIQESGPTSDLSSSDKQWLPAHDSQFAQFPFRMEALQTLKSAEMARAVALSGEVYTFAIPVDVSFEQRNHHCLDSGATDFFFFFAK